MPNNYPNPQRRDDSEDEIQYQRERSAENRGTSSGLVFGSLLVAVIGLGGLATYYWTRPAPTPTTIINTPPNPTVSVSPAPPKTTIIDRTVEKTAPPQVKVVEVEKPVIVTTPAAPPKIIEVPKPYAVPGATKVIEVPTKPAAAPPTPSTADKSDAAKPIATPSVPPTSTGTAAEPATAPSPESN